MEQPHLFAAEPVVALTDEQQAAVVATGDVLVSAAAGSGKTRVLVERIVRAVTSEGVPLDGVVAVTFTEKAAQEIRERVSDRLLAVGEAELAARLEGAWIGTIHGLCTRLLRRYGARIGIDPGFRVLDGAQSAYLRSRAVREAIDAGTAPDVMELRIRYGDARVEEYLLAAAAAASQRVDRSVDFPDHADGQILHGLHAEFVRRYAALCVAAGGLDFDELQHAALRALADPDVTVEVRYRIQRVLVDEFQDTNALQCAIIDRIGAGCTFAVGDEWQSIYRFRAADVEVFRERAACARDQVLAIRENFRSRPQVLETVNRVFGSQFGDRYAPVIAHRDPSPTPVGCELLLVPRISGAGRAAEAQVVADRVAGLLRDGADASDIALLFARQTHASTFEDALGHRGIRAVRSASTGYWDQQQVRDVLALLAWVGNRRDDHAALAVLAAPWVGLGLEDLLRLRSSGSTVWEAVCADSDSRLEAVRTLVAELAERAHSRGLVDVVARATFAEPHYGRVLRGPQGRRRIANMRKLVELAASAENIGVDTLGRFLELASAHAATAVEGEATIADEATGAVRLMTIHASKGLEFPYVFICDAANAGRRQAPRILFNATGRAAHETIGTNGEVRCPDELVHLREAERAEADAEERRLFYVGLTRARERLWISGTLGPKPSGPLAWLKQSLTETDLAAIRVTRVNPEELSAAVESADVGGTVQTGVAPAWQLPTEILQVTPWPDDLLGQEALESSADAGRPVPYGEIADAHAAVAGREERAAGEAAHALLARALTTRVQGTPDRGLTAFSADIAAGGLDAVVERVQAVVESATFSELVSAGASAEVPYMVVLPDGAVDSGRFDAVAVDGHSWWIVDYKSRAPQDPDLAWVEHGEQLARYADAAFAAGAKQVRLTLLGLEHPGQPLEWTLSASRTLQEA